MKYDKLVRDKIVSKLLFDKQIVSFRHIDAKHQRISCLVDKLQEERNELMEAINRDGDILNEIVDVIEVVQALGAQYGFKKRHIERARRKKVLRLGGFKHFFFLENVEKPDEA